jgi:hypothetical protein
MTVITADVAMKVEDAAKQEAPTVGGFDMALVMHLAATRFGSPAGIAFLPQSYLPFLTARRR